MTVFNRATPATLLGADWDVIGAAKCATCAHCNKKLPKFPFAVEVDGIKHTVGADCILDNVEACINPKGDRTQTFVTGVEINMMYRRSTIEQMIKRTKMDIKRELEDRNVDEVG